MAFVKVILGRGGFIEKYRLPHYVNSINFNSAFDVGSYIMGAADCQVFDSEGTHVRDAIIDLRGNVADFDVGEKVREYEQLCLDQAEYIATPERRRFPINRIQGPRLSVGYGNIFGIDFVASGMEDEPRSAQNLCSIGSWCCVGANVSLSTEKGFRIQNRCAIGNGTTILGHLDMADGSTLGTNVRLCKNGRLRMERFSRVGDRVLVAGDIDLGKVSALGDRVHVKQTASVEVPINSAVPAGFVIAGWEDLSLYQR